MAKLSPENNGYNPVWPVDGSLSPSFLSPNRKQGLAGSVKIPKFVLNMTRGVCKISISGGYGGTGFLLHIKDNNLYALATAGHVISEDNLKEKIGIDFEEQKKEADFLITVEDVFYNSTLDATILSIRKGDVKKFENADCKFLEGDVEQQFVCVLEQQERRVAKGNLLNELKYDASTASGSSGSPIISKNKKVIGIHHSGAQDANIGTPLSKIYLAMQDSANRVKNLVVELHIRVKKAKKDDSASDEEEDPIIVNKEIFNAILTHKSYDALLRYLKEHGILDRSSYRSVSNATDKPDSLLDVLISRSRKGTLQRLACGLRLYDFQKEANQLDKENSQAVCKERKVLDKIRSELIKDLVAGETLLTFLQDKVHYLEDKKISLLREEDRKTRTEMLMDHLHERGAIGTVLAIISGLEDLGSKAILPNVNQIIKKANYC